jgi:hypothetical protein
VASSGTVPQRPFGTTSPEEFSVPHVSLRARTIHCLEARSCGPAVERTGIFSRAYSRFHASARSMCAFTPCFDQWARPNYELRYSQHGDCACHLALWSLHLSLLSIRTSASRRTERTEPVCTKLLIHSALRLGQKQKPDESRETRDCIRRGGENIRRSPRFRSGRSKVNGAGRPSEGLRVFLWFYRSHTRFLWMERKKSSALFQPGKQLRVRVETMKKAAPETVTITSAEVRKRKLPKAEVLQLKKLA